MINLIELIVDGICWIQLNQPTLHGMVSREPETKVYEIWGISFDWLAPYNAAKFCRSVRDIRCRNFLLPGKVGHNLFLLCCVLSDSSIMVNKDEYYPNSCG